MNKITSPTATASLTVATVSPGSVSGRSAEPVIGYAYTLNNDGDPEWRSPHRRFALQSS